MKRNTKAGLVLAICAGMSANTLYAFHSMPNPFFGERNKKYSGYNGKRPVKRRNPNRR